MIYFNLFKNFNLKEKLSFYKIFSQKWIFLIKSPILEKMGGDLPPRPPLTIRFRKYFMADLDLATLNYIILSKY